MRHALTARLLGAGALAAALLLGAGCRDNASPEENAPELQQPTSGAAPAAPGTGGAGSAGTEAPQAGDTQPTDMSGRPATGNTESSEAGAEPQEEEKGASPGGRTPPGHELETR